MELANGGGRVVLTVLETQLKNYLGTVQLHRKEAEIQDLLSNLLDFESVAEKPGPGGRSPVETLLISSIRLYGGDPSFETMDLTRCADNGEMQRILRSWIEPLPLHPTMLDTQLDLISIPNLLSRQGMTEEAKSVDEAAKKIFGKSFLLSDAKKSYRWSFW